MFPFFKTNCGYCGATIIVEQEVPGYKCFACSYGNESPVFEEVESCYIYVNGVKVNFTQVAFGGMSDKLLGITRPALKAEWKQDGKDRSQLSMPMATLYNFCKELEKVIEVS